MSEAVAAVEIDVVRAELIERISSEKEVLNRKLEAQRDRQEIENELKTITLKLNQRMNACVDTDIASSAILSAIETDKHKLLRMTPEGKQILTLQSEIKELKWVKGDPQLPVLSRRIEVAQARNDEAEVRLLESRISALQSKIDQRQREIDRLWTDFGFEADSLPSV